MLRTIGFIILFYFVMRILKSLFEPKTGVRASNNNAPQRRPKEKAGEFIDYEEVN
jgi:hypothetical protein